MGSWKESERMPSREYNFIKNPCIHGVFGTGKGEEEVKQGGVSHLPRGPPGKKVTDRTRRMNQKKVP